MGSLTTLIATPTTTHVLHVLGSSSCLSTICLSLPLHTRLHPNLLQLSQREKLSTSGVNSWCQVLAGCNKSSQAGMGGRRGEPGGNLWPKNGAFFLAAHKLRRPDWHTNPWTGKLSPHQLKGWHCLRSCVNYCKGKGRHLFPMIPWEAGGRKGKDVKAGSHRILWPSSLTSPSLIFLLFLKGGQEQTCVPISFDYGQCVCQIVANREIVWEGCQLELAEEAVAFSAVFLMNL